MSPWQRRRKKRKKHNRNRHSPVRILCRRKTHHSKPDRLLEHAEHDFEEKFGFSRGGKDAWNITISNPEKTVCLQAVDYFLWAVQRFYEVRRNPQTGEEVREDRFLNMLLPQIGEIHDLDHGPTQGTFYTAQQPLTIADRFGEKATKKKKP